MKLGFVSEDNSGGIQLSKMKKFDVLNDCVLKVTGSQTIMPKWDYKPTIVNIDLVHQ